MRNTPETSPRGDAESRSAIRALRVLLAAKKAVIRTKEEGNLYQAVCAAIPHEGGYPLAWIALPEFDARKSVRIAASAGYGAEYLNALEVSWGEGPLGKVQPDVHSLGADCCGQPRGGRCAASPLARAGGKLRIPVHRHAAIAPRPEVDRSAGHLRLRAGCVRCRRDRLVGGVGGRPVVRTGTAGRTTVPSTSGAGGFRGGERVPYGDRLDQRCHLHCGFQRTFAGSEPGGVPKPGLSGRPGWEDRSASPNGSRVDSLYVSRCNRLQCQESAPDSERS